MVLAKLVAFLKGFIDETAQLHMRQLLLSCSLSGNSRSFVRCIKMADIHCYYVVSSIVHLLWSLDLRVLFEAFRFVRIEYKTFGCAFVLKILK